MRSKWMAWAWSNETISNPTAKAVLLAVADHADEAGFCRPSVERLGKLTCLDPRTVQRQLKALEALGLIRREIGGGWIPKSGDKNQGRASSYQLIGEPGLTVTDGGIHPGAMPPKIETTPAQSHRGNRDETTLPRHSVTPTEVRETEGGGGSARAPMHEREPAREATTITVRRPDPVDRRDDQRVDRTDSQDLTEREELLEAMGHHPTGMTVRGKIAGNAVDMAEVRRWSSDLGISHADQLAVIRDAMASKREPGPPTSFTYFTKPMARFAGEQARPPLKPIYPTENYGERANGTSNKRHRLLRIIDAASEGTSGQDWG